ncbi:hypothetical protein QYE76_000418 [Lolium multiflorum]|uniref:Uncharacterized protein n=1 Tax=Lolium multiflorum TaxID=4521 RepID=A0AAD8VYC2_LOLMU|nr:hypothetical protein QYE76_000418 [Lolium multiflorum]
MDAKLKIFAMLMLFCLCKGGDASEQCGLSDLKVNQTAVGNQVGGLQEYSVEVENKCICTQTNVKLLCSGFNSSIPVDPSVISLDPDGKYCTLVNGRAVRRDDVIKFNYAWSIEFSFLPVSSGIACS